MPVEVTAAGVGERIMRTVAPVGILDTKGAECDFARACLHDAGVETVTVDRRALLPPPGRVGISRREVGNAAGERTSPPLLPPAAADGALFQIMRTALEGSTVQLIYPDTNINDACFAAPAASLRKDMIAAQPRRASAG